MKNRRQVTHKDRKVTHKVRCWIEPLLHQDLSPHQVIDYPGRFKKISLHHETVYQLIYQDQADSGDLQRHVRVISKPYRKRYGNYDRRAKIKAQVSIHDRPAAIVSVIGKMTPAIGKGPQSALLTLVERKNL